MSNLIEIYEITKLTNGYEVEYDFEGNEIKLLISNSELVEFVKDNNLNYMEIVNQDATDIDNYYVDAETLLHEDYYSIVSQYLNDLHK